MRINRNRCQQCRFKKCLSVGMSRDGEHLVHHEIAAHWHTMKYTSNFVTFSVRFKPAAVRFGRIPKREKQRMLAEMQNAMNNMVNNQLQNEFQMASITSNTPCSSSSSPSTSSSPCPGITVAPQPPAAPTPPSPSPPAPDSTSAQPAQSPPPVSSSPPLCPSPGVDNTIAAITRAHRETFVYAHDKLGLTLLPHNGDMDNRSSNRCTAGYHLNSQNTIYHHDNNVNHHRNNFEAPLENGQHFQASSGSGMMHNNNSNIYGVHQEMNTSSQGHNCPWKKRKEILLVRHW